MQLTDDFKLQDFSLSHRLRHTQKGAPASPINGSSQDADMSMWLGELAMIKDHLEPYNLALVTVPITFFKSIGQLEEPSEEKIAAFVRDIYDIHGSEVRIGLDFSSQVLFNADEVTMVSYLNLIEYLNRMSFSTAAVYFPLECITVACNAFTYEKAARIIALSRSLTIPVAATEVLRSHPRRPGAVTLPVDPFVQSSYNSVHKQASLGFGSPPTPSPSADTLSSEAEGEPSREPLDVLNRALKTCLSLERQYMSRFVPPPVPASQICWAHTLLSSFHSEMKSSTDGVAANLDPAEIERRKKNVILFAEEWDYVLRTRIQPVFDSSSASLLKHSEEVADWRTIYKPLANILFRAYTDVLRVSEPKAVVKFCNYWLSITCS